MWRAEISASSARRLTIRSSTSIARSSRARRFFDSNRSRPNDLITLMKRALSDKERGLGNYNVANRPMTRCNFSPRSAMATRVRH